MSNESRSFGFSEFASANSERVVSGVDYVRAIYVSQNLPADFIVHFSRLFWPKIKTVDGVIFLEECFDALSYQELLRSGKTPSEVQFWVNLTEITGIFDRLAYEEAVEIARVISSCWNSKLTSEFGAPFAQAKVILDEEEGEVFVTIGSHG